MIVYDIMIDTKAWNRRSARYIPKGSYVPGYRDWYGKALYRTEKCFIFYFLDKYGTFRSIQ